MADLKLKDFVDESDLQKLVELDNTIERVRADYANAAKELAKGLKLNVEGVADLEKLSNLYNTQAKTAGSASAELTEALRKQSEITQTVSKKIEEKLNVEKLSAAELKKLTKANSDNAVSLEKAAKAEANLTKAQNAGNTTRKKAVLSEEERLKLIRTAIILTNQEVHSRSQAKEMNKQLQKAVDVLKDTDENYIRTLARLNSTIGINTDYIKRNSDRYSQQKMTIGAYREEVKAAWVEIQNGNKSMQNMGIIARNAGRMLKTEMAPGLSQVSAGLKGWAAGYIGAQAVVGGIVKMFTQLREGVGSIVEFEFANSKLAAILGTTADNIKEWIGAEQMEAIYGMSKDARCSFVHRHKIPSRVVYGKVQYSKDHIDIIKNGGFDQREKYYSVAEAMEKYGLRRDDVYNYARYNNIRKMHHGKSMFLLKEDFDKVMAEKSVT